MHFFPSHLKVKRHLVLVSQKRLMKHGNVCSYIVLKYEKIQAMWLHLQRTLNLIMTLKSFIYLFDITPRSDEWLDVRV